MTTDDFCFYLQNRLIQTSQTGGQWYSDTSPFSVHDWTVLALVYLETLKDQNSIEKSDKRSSHKLILVLAADTVCMEVLAADTVCMEVLAADSGAIFNPSLHLVECH
jgi:hypothetical protein